MDKNIGNIGASTTALVSTEKLRAYLLYVRTRTYLSVACTVRIHTGTVYAVGKIMPELLKNNRNCTTIIPSRKDRG